MVFRVVDSISLASDTHNEDRLGHKESEIAWVIDGATDVLEEPLLGAGSDASWFAETVHRTLASQVTPKRLTDLPAQICQTAALEFQAAALRKPAGRHEHPSATGIIVRSDDDRIEYVAVGDCALIACSRSELHTVGLGGKEAGDRSTAQAVANFQTRNCGASPEDAKTYMWPKIRAQRAKMNTPDGYGALSLTVPPRQFVITGAFELTPDDHILIASDGLMRLIELYHRYDAQQLLNAAIEQGLASLVGELRDIETSDASCRAYPRVKAKDDATGMLLRII